MSLKLFGQNVTETFPPTRIVADIIPGAVRGEGGGGGFGHGASKGAGLGPHGGEVGLRGLPGDGLVPRGGGDWMKGGFGEILEKIYIKKYLKKKMTRAPVKNKYI